MFLGYSQVPNKRGGVGIIGVGGLEMVRHNNNRGGGGVGIIGGAAWRNRKQPFS